VVRTQEPQPIQGKGKNTLVAGGQPDQDQDMTSPDPRTAVGDRGLNATGHITREGSLDRIAPEFRALIDETRRQLDQQFRRRLHSPGFPGAGFSGAYLYGSIPRGTAVAGRSDLDVLITLRSDPSDIEKSRAGELGRWLADRHPEITSAGLLVESAPRVLAPAERHDFGFFVACLCTPLLGEDLAALLPWYRPTRELARETNGDLGRYLARTRDRLAAPGTDRPALLRTAARKVIRTGFTLVMPRWSGWTSDLDRSAEVFGGYYPDRADQMRQAVTLARRAPGRDPDTPATWEPGRALLFDELGPWLAAEYAREIGVKDIRP
jgi:hypothetical protein